MLLHQWLRRPLLALTFGATGAAKTVSGGWCIINVGDDNRCIVTVAFVVFYWRICCRLHWSTTRTACKIWLGCPVFSLNGSSARSQFDESWATLRPLTRLCPSAAPNDGTAGRVRACVRARVCLHRVIDSSLAIDQLASELYGVAPGSSVVKYILTENQ